MIREKLTRLRQDCAGTVGIDWIVLTASVVGLAVVVIASIQAGDDGLAANVSSYFASDGVF